MTDTARTAPLRVAVVDDEPYSRAKLLRLLEDEDDVEVVAVCADGREAVDACLETRPDLLLLDVQMPEMDGFAVLEALGPEQVPMVIFVTAYDRHALRAFDANALDYLLKPFEDERFRRALARARDRLRGRSGPEAYHRKIGALLEQMAAERRQASKQAEYLEWIWVTHRGKGIPIRTRDVDWIRAEDNYIRLHVGEANYLIRETMNAFEQRLDPRRFARIHRSSIVNLDRIREIRRWDTGTRIVVLRDGTELRLSRHYRGTLGALVGQYL